MLMTFVSKHQRATDYTDKNNCGLQYTLASCAAKTEITVLQNLLNPREFLETSVGYNFADIDVAF